MKAIDSFAGLGGFTLGAHGAGVRVVWAANHWRAAVETHIANHPSVDHACQDLHQAAWDQVPAHDLLLASPSCTGHTRARGREQKHHDAARSTAWAVVSCAEVHRPDVCVVENVPEFRSWALYPAWCAAMGALGYSLAKHVIDAADHGVPQNRVRLFVVAARSLAPMKLTVPVLPQLAVSGILDPDDTARWSQVYRRGRSAKTLRRVERGREQHGGRFLVPYYGSTRGGRSVDRPIGTVTTVDRWALVDGDRMRMLSIGESRRAMGFPESYRLPKSHKLALHMLGNAVCPPVVTLLLREIVARG